MSPSKPSGGTVRLIGGIVAALCLAIFFNAVWEQPEEPPFLPAPLPVEDRDERRQELREAFANQRPLLKEEIMQQVEPLFTQLEQAFRDLDRDKLVAQFDIERLFDELRAMELAPVLTERQRRDFVRGFQTGMGKSLIQQAPLLQWRRVEIRNVKMLPNNEAILTARHHDDDGISMRMRWWVSNRSGSWKVFDLEDLDIGLRFTATGASVLQLGAGKVMQAAKAVQHMRTALLAVAQRQDPDEAARHLALAENVQLPAKIDALRHMIHGVIAAARGQFEKALESYDSAAGLNPDMPCLDLLKGIALNSLSRWKEALAYLHTYQELLGDDAAVCQEIGNALLNLGRAPEACVAYRKSLDDFQKNPDAFLSLIRALGANDDRSDLADRFTHLDSQHENFCIFAEDCRQASDAATLLVLAPAMQKIDGQFAAADYYLSLARIWTGRTDDGVALFKQACTKEKKAEDRQRFVSGFLDAMAKARKPLEAYAVVSDHAEAFRFLAGELQRGFQNRLLQRLLMAHEKNAPDDPLILFYRGEALVAQRRYDLADKTFTAALAAKRLDKGTLANFRTGRVAARYHTADALSAYQLHPGRQTFTQLANLCVADAKWPALEALLEEHQKNDPNDPELRRSQFRVKIARKQVGEAVALFQQVYEQQRTDDERLVLLEGFLFDMLDAHEVLAGYQAAPDARRAFAILAADLLDSRRKADLHKLIDAHRQQHADDPWLAFYTVESFINGKEWHKAAAVLDTVWKTLPDDARPRFFSTYIFALFKTGRGLEAYQIDPGKAFNQLANLYLAEKATKELAALIEAHRARAPDDPDALYVEARLKVLAGDMEQAVRLMEGACRKQAQEYRRGDYVRGLAQAFANAGKGLAFARAVTDKTEALPILAEEFLIKRQPADLAELLDEWDRVSRQQQAKNLLDEAQRNLYRGELCLLRNEPAAAVKNLQAALAANVPQTSWRAKQALLRARVKAGKALAAFHEASDAFEELADSCFIEKDASQLQELIEQQRKLYPDENLSIWEAEVKWLNKDYAGLLEQIRADHSIQNRWKLNSWRVRCLVRLQRHEEAIKEAEKIVEQRGDRLLLVLSLAASGDIKRTMAAVANEQFLVDSCYWDDDLGPILRSEPFVDFRAAYPPPKDRLDRLSR